jgi:hypothetical protein
LDTYFSVTWGLIFSAFPNLRIIHRAGRVHSNVDPISRLRRRVPPQTGPAIDDIEYLNFNLSENEEVLVDMYKSLGERFEEKLLTVASNYANIKQLSDTDEANFSISYSIKDMDISLNYHTSRSYSIIVNWNKKEKEEWILAYHNDSHFSKVIKDRINFPQYHFAEDGLLYFQDNQGNMRLCVPQSFRLEIMNEVHNEITESAHAGYFKTYNRISSTYYWPKMSREIKKFVQTCDICQKSKPRRQAPAGELHSIPIPDTPFEVITMDFIVELPESDGYNSILVIVDKLTKYALFVPTTTKLTDIEAAKLFFHHIITHFGIPHQVITDRDPRWRENFWKEIC